MSRSGDGYDGGEQFANESAFYRHRMYLALRGRKGRKALVELREALLSLPEPRLVADALSTVGKTEISDDPMYRYVQDEHRELIEAQGEGMCAVAVYAWHKRVRAGEDPDEVMRDLPLAPAYDSDPWTTVYTGTKAGLSEPLAWALMQRNDDYFDGMTPEGRYTAMLDWIEEQLSAPPLPAPQRKVAAS